MTRRVNFSQEEIEVINDLAKRGYSPQQIAKEMDRSTNGVRRYIRWDEIPPKQDVTEEEVRDVIFEQLDRIGPKSTRKMAVRSVMNFHHVPLDMAIRLYNRWRMEYLDGMRGKWL